MAASQPAKAVVRSPQDGKKQSLQEAAPVHQGATGSLEDSHPHRPGIQGLSAPATAYWQPALASSSRRRRQHSLAVHLHVPPMSKSTSTLSPSTIEQLLALQQIQQLKARYCRFIDTKRWQDLRAIFTPDCQFEGMGNLPISASVDTFVNHVAKRHAHTISAHHCHTPEFRFLSDREARGIWAMEDFVEWQGLEHVSPDWAGFKGFRAYGHYEEAYRRDDDDGAQWRISFIRLTRLRMDGVAADSEPPRSGALKASADWL